MALIAADRVQETSTTTGTGTITLVGALTGFRSFADIGDTNTCHYLIEAVDGNGAPSGEWEVGFGTYTLAGTTLARGTVFSNSLGTTAKINFSAGTKHVSNTNSALNGRTVGCSLKLMDDQSYLNLSRDLVLFEAADHESWDTDGFHETVTNPARATIPAGFDGIYECSVTGNWVANTSGYRGLYLVLKNSGGTILDGNIDRIEPSPSFTTGHQTVLITRCVGGDYFEFSQEQNSGGALGANGGNENASMTNLILHRIGN